MFICTVQKKKFNGYRVSTKEKKRDAHHVYSCFDASWLGQKKVGFFFLFKHPGCIWLICAAKSVNSLSFCYATWVTYTDVDEFFSVRCHTSRKGSNNKRTMLVYVLSNFLWHRCWIFAYFYLTAVTLFVLDCWGKKQTLSGRSSGAAWSKQPWDWTILWNWSLKRLMTAI